MVEVALSGRDTVPGQALAKRAVHVSIVNLDVPEPMLRTCHSILDEAEVGRASRFRFDRDRRRWVVARASLRRTLSHYTGMRPEDIRLRAGAHGKPALEGEIARLEFNLSHSSGLALIAVTRLAPVGVDIERVKNIADMDAIIRSQFSTRERAQIGRMAPADRLNAFYNCWTRKEAVIKAIGAGLAIPLTAFDVSVTPDETTMLHSADESVGNPRDWSLFHLEPGTGYVGALAINSSGPVDVTFMTGIDDALARRGVRAKRLPQE